MPLIRDFDANLKVGPPVPHGSQFGKFNSKDDVPEGAIIMSKQEMQQFMLRTIRKWEPQDEMWAFRYGSGLTASGSILSGVYFNAVLRNKFKLRNFGPLLTFGPTCIIPCVTTLMVQQFQVTDRLLVNDFDCPACAQIRSSTLLLTTGFIQPLFMSLLSCSIIASYKCTIKVPRLTQPRDVFSTFSKMLRPSHLAMSGLLLVNTGLAIFVTQQQQLAVSKVHQRIGKGP